MDVLVLCCWSQIPPILSGKGGGRGLQLVEVELDAERISQIDDAHLGIVAGRLRDIERCWGRVMSAMRSKAARGQLERRPH